MRAVRSHAGLEDVAHRPSVSEALGRSGQIDAAVADFLDVLQQMNVDLNGRVPSQTAGGAEVALPAGLVYAIAEVARMLRDQGHDDDAWAVDTAWLAVLGGDIDDIGAHVVLERAARG